MIQVINRQLRDIPRPNQLPDILNMAITGGIGSGKSSVAKWLQSYGAAIVDLDRIAHQVTGVDGAAMNELVAHFGKTILNSDGSLNRSIMRGMIYQDASAKQVLEQITHRHIFNIAMAQAHEVVKLNPLCIVFDIPLLVGKTLWLSLLDSVIVVDCALDERIRRVLARNADYDRALVERIISNQPTSEQVRAIADVMIDNSSALTNNLPVSIQINILLGYINDLSSQKSNQLKHS